MANPLNIIYNATSKDTIVTLKTSAVAVAAGVASLIVFAGAGRDKWFDINQVSDTVEHDKGCDDSDVFSISPKGNKLEGSFTFNPSSPTVAQLAQLTTVQYRLGNVFNCTLVIENISNGTVMQYNKFVVSSNYKGNPFDDKIPDYTYNFKCPLPSYVDLSSLINLIGTI